MRARFFRYLVIPVCFIVAAPGCQTSRPRPVVIAVRDAETKKPIPGAAVQISCPRTQAPRPLDDSSAKADAQGIVRLSAEPNGQYPHTIEAVAPGYMSSHTAVPAADIARIARPGLFENVEERPATQTVELYADPKFNVELVLLPGFRGVIKAEVKIKDDLPLTPGQRKFSFPVEGDGLVRVTGPGIALRRVSMANYVARDADGTIFSGTAAPTQIGFRWFRRDPQFEYFFVGTQDDFDRLRRNLPPEEKSHTHSSSGRSSGSGHGGHGGGGRGGSGASGGGTIPGVINAD